jgi:outer membrane protein insertion porin family
VGIAGGVLGGEFNIVRPIVEFRHFRPDVWISKGRNTLGFRFLAEYARAYSGSTLPFFDRFYIGGETTIRGFDIRSISPLAITSTPQFDPNGNPIIDLNNGLAKIDRSLVPVGGDALGILNFEYRIPIAGPLSVAGFTDVGITHVFSKTTLGDFGTSRVDLIRLTNTVPRASVGAEVQFMLPMIGAPFRLIFAYNPLVFDDIIQLGNVPLRAQEPRRDIKFTIGRSF